MTRQWRVPAFVFVLVAALSFVGVRIQANTGGGAPSEEPAPDIAAFTYSPIQDLAELHDLMIDEGLPLVMVDIIDVDADADPPVVALVTTSVLWTPHLEAELTPEPVESRLRDAEQADIATLRDVRNGATGVAVLDNQDRLVAMAELDVNGSSFVVPRGQPTGPMFLAAAAESLFVGQVDPVPGSSACDDAAAGFEPYGSPLDAIVRYFADLDTRSVTDRVAALAGIEDSVERLVIANSELSDTVTGRVMGPSRNDLARQLRSGRPEEEVVIRPALPIGVRVSPALDDEASQGQVAVFVAEPSGFVLGWTVMIAAYEIVEDGSKVAITERVVEMEPPPVGDDLAVYVRSVSAADFACSPTNGEVPVVVVDYDHYAGAGRALIDLSTYTFEDARDL